MRRIILISILFLSCHCMGSSLFGQFPELEAYVQEAAQNNSGLRSTHDQYLAALESVPGTGTLPNPEISFGYFISPVETRVGPQQFRFSAMQMFPWFGTLSSREKVSEQMAKAKFETFIAERNQLALEVKTIWFGLYELEHSIKITEQHLEILHSFEQLATTRSEQGKGSMVDILRIQMETAKVENDLKFLKDKREIMIADFNRVLGRESNQSLTVRDTLPPAQLSWIKSQLQDSILSKNPGLKRFQRQSDAMALSGESVRKSGLPSFGVGINYIATGPRQGTTVEGNGRDAFLPMISLSLPIYREKYNSRTTEAELLQQSYESAEEDLANRLQVQMESVWREYEDAKRRDTLYSEQLEKAKQTQEILILGYTTSGKDFEEILRVQRMILDYEAQRVRAIRDQYIKIAQLEMLSGKY